jgi:HAE1 family hydrophobic/amphiphilic exporter-1
MHLSRLAVRRPVTILMVYGALVILGVVAYRMLPVQLLPDFTLPTIGVFAGKPDGSPPENMETLTKPIEGIIAELPRVKRIRSWTGSWGTWIRIDFAQGTDIRFATIDLQERLNAFQQTLNDRRASIEVYPFTTDSFKNFLMEVSVQGPSDEEFLHNLVRDKVAPQLTAISGVAKVEIGGVTSPAADVELDTSRMAGFGLPFERVFARIQAAGTQDSYVGRLRIPGETHYVRIDQPVRDVGELKRIFVDDRGIVALADIADVAQGQSLDQWVYRANGNNAVGLWLEREEGENMIAVAGKVRQRVDEINATMPQGYRVSIETDIAEMVQDVVNQVRRLSVYGALLALLVPLVFFRSWRIALIIFISVPICIVAVFNLFYFFGMSINIFSIVGLALGVGMLVDNSIVVVENCFRLYFGRHFDALKAAAMGGDEVGRALFASTLTSCIPFVSLFFIEGEFRLFVKEPALALVFPLMLSLAVALSLSAMLTSKALQTVVRHSGAVGEEEWRRAARRLNPTKSRLREVYRFLLKGCLRHRARVLAAIALMLAFVWLEACDRVRDATVNRENQQEVFRVYLEMPPGTTTAEASNIVGFVEQRLLKHEDLKRFAVWFRQERATFDLVLPKTQERPSRRSLSEVRARIIDFVGEVPGGNLSLTHPERRGVEEITNLGDRGAVALKGLDHATIELYANRLIDAIEVLPQVSSAAIRSDNQQFLFENMVDRDKTKVFGLSSQELGQYMGLTRASGQISSLVLKDGEKRTDVTISVAERRTDTIDDVQALPVHTRQGTAVGLGELTRLRTGMLPGGQGRLDRQSSLTVEYFFPPGTDQSALANQIRGIIRALPNPAGITAEFEGAQRQLEQSQKDFIFMLLTGVLMIYIVMAAIFESYWVPFTIIVTNPLMLVGIVFALAITNLPFDELAAFGVILLNGLAVNNGIVLMDTALRYRKDHNYRRLRAVFQAADQRLRPIVMTFLTTTLGLLPLALFGGEESQWRPVAVTVVGGLTSATLLTLLVLPCFYMIGDDFVAFVRPWWLWFLATVFRSLERVVNGVTHALFAVAQFWKWRPQLWPPVVWRALKWSLRLLLASLPVALWRATRAVVRGVWRLGRALAGDLAFVAGRGRATSESPVHPAITHRDPAAIPPIEIQNLHVVYAEGGLHRATRLLPKGDVPFGHQPVPGFEALRQVTLTIQPGVFGLLGPNGAGKTTLMRCIAGLLEPTRGTVRLYGVPRRDAGEGLAPLVGYLPQTHGLYEWMTLRQYLEYFALLTARTRCTALAVPDAFPLLAARLQALDALDSPTARARAIARVAAEVHLEQFLEERLGNFSGGMKQRAGIARVLLQAPPILIVDEPTAGLDPMERVSVRLLLAQIARERTVIFSTHIVEDLEGTATAIGILDRGRLRFHGSPDELRASWQGRVWDIAVAEHEGERLGEELGRQGGRLLYRTARGGVARWRCLAPQRPCEDAVAVPVSLEDAFHGTLGMRAT